MSLNIYPSDINQTFIIEPLSVTGATPIISACTSVYTDNIISCSGNTQIFIGSGVISFDGSIYTDQDLSANTINASTYFSGGTNLIDIINEISNQVTGGTPNNASKLYTFTNNTGGTFNVTALTDLTITGGTYSAGTAIFTNNTGGTFSVSGFSTGSTFSSPSLQSVINVSPNITGGTLATTSGTSINIADNVITLSATSVGVQGTPGNNANLIINSPIGSTTPTISFYSNGSTPVASIYGSAGILYLGGIGGYPVMIDNADIALPNQTADSLTYFDISKRLRSATIGSGLTLISGTLTATGGTVTTQNGLSSTGSTIELGGNLLHNTNLDLSGKTLSVFNNTAAVLSLDSSKISIHTGDTSFYTSANVVYLDIENYKSFIIRNSSIGQNFMSFSHNTGAIAINGTTKINNGIIPSDNVTLNIGAQGSGADATVSALGVSKIAFTSAGGGYGMYAIGSQSTGFYGMPTMRFNYDYASFGYTGDSNNGYRVGIGVDTESTYRVNIADGLKVSGDSLFTNGLTANTISVNPIIGLSATTAQTINLSLSDQFSYTLSGNTTFTFSNNSNGKSWIVGVMTNPSVSGYTSSFTATTASIKWPYNITPVQTATINKTDIFSFTQLNDIIYGDYSQSY